MEVKISSKICKKWIFIFFVLDTSFFVSGMPQIINNKFIKHITALIKKGVFIPNSKSHDHKIGHTINPSPKIIPKRAKLWARSFEFVEISVRIDWIVLIFHAAMPLTILPIIYHSTVFHNPIIKADKKLVKTDIKRIGFLQYLSDKKPNNGAENNAKIE